MYLDAAPTKVLVRQSKNKRVKFYKMNISKKS